MYSIVNILCCIALVCSPLTLAGDSQLSRRSPRPKALESHEYLPSKSNEEESSKNDIALIKLSDSNQVAAVALEIESQSSNITETELNSSTASKETTEDLTWALGGDEDDDNDSDNSSANETNAQMPYYSTSSQQDLPLLMSSKTSSVPGITSGVDSLLSITSVNSETPTNHNESPTSVVPMSKSSQLAMSSADSPTVTNFVTNYNNQGSVVSSSVLTSSTSLINSITDKLAPSSSSEFVIKGTETISTQTPSISSSTSSIELIYPASSSSSTDGAILTKTIVSNSTQPIATESYYSSTSPTVILSSKTDLSSTPIPTSDVISMTQISNMTAPAPTMSFSSSAEVSNTIVYSSTTTSFSTAMDSNATTPVLISTSTYLPSTSLSSVTQTSNATASATTMTLSSTATDSNATTTTLMSTYTDRSSTSLSSVTPISNVTISDPTATSSTTAIFSTTVPKMTGTSSLEPSSTDVYQYPSNSTSTLQSNTMSIPPLSTGTAFSTSYTLGQSSTLVPITANTTTVYSPGVSTTIPPYQATSLTPNATYATSALNYTSPATSQTSGEITGTSSIPTIVMPTATNTGSTFIPSSIIAQTSATYTTGQTSTLSTGIPSALPKIVQNPLTSSSPSQPVDTAEVQIGFEWALNYPFVVGHPLSTSQIFTYLPIGIADGMGLKPEQIVVENLFPLDTTAELQYITTVARVFIPASMVDTLRINLGIAASPLYQNDDESVRTLMNYINPAIPFFPGSVMDPEPSSSVTDTQSSPTSNSGDSGVFNSNPQPSQSASAKGTTAGIALAACGGAAAYGAAMFLLARRYKHRQQRPKRSDSLEGVSDESDMAENPNCSGEVGALMTGGRVSPAHDRHSRGSGRTGHSARTAHISAPMMAENSLGWN